MITFAMKIVIYFVLLALGGGGGEREYYGRWHLPIHIYSIIQYNIIYLYNLIV